MRLLLSLVAVVAALCLTSAPASARQIGGVDDDFSELLAPESGDELSRSIAIRLGYFDQDDTGGGNPFLDESLTVIEPIVVFDWDVSKDLGYTIKAAYDNVTSASIDRLSKYPDQSGASGDNWFGLEFGMRHRVNDEWRAGWHVGASAEYDYTSIKAGGQATWTPGDGRDASVTTSLDIFFDQVDVIRFNGVEDGTDQRISFASTTQWYQVLTPTMYSLAGVTLGYQSGFLETAYNGVVVEDGATPPFPFDNDALGTEITEQLPDLRLRLALYGRLRQQIVEGTAVELGARVYGDDWGIVSGAIEPRLYHVLVHDRLLLRLRYRYYAQTGADDYYVSLPGGEPVPEFHTSDSDLGEFDSQSFGIKLVWFRRSSWEFDIGADHVVRDDGLDSSFASIGFKTHL